jgi:hypothetical protein
LRRGGADRREFASDEIRARNQVSLKGAMGCWAGYQRSKTADQPIAQLCHAAQMLAAAGTLTGRRTAAYPALAPDVVAAGAEFVDRAAVIDGQMVSARAWPDHRRGCASSRRSCGPRRRAGPDRRVVRRRTPRPSAPSVVVYPGLPCPLAIRARRSAAVTPCLAGPHRGLDMLPEQRGQAAAVGLAGQAIRRNPVSSARASQHQGLLVTQRGPVLDKLIQAQRQTLHTHIVKHQGLPPVKSVTRRGSSCLVWGW